ncbi:exosortase A [Sphingomonas sp.]|uniref:exosortase A n=1 Tax=Sphingomonas sp. TaxID=28214 RepID=UPI001D39E8C5|nr:exosortase A [Sphingomonas sp.]MBX9796338.1 exosortase A [Sphingomonas sp.]
MTIALDPAAFVAPGTAWRRHGLVLAVTATLIAALFAADSADLARLWWTSTTFGHCLFIGPVIFWLVWLRRRELAELAPVGWAPGLALVMAGALGWLMGAAAEVALARHLGLVMMMQGAVVTILGPQVARALLFPIAYAFFLVPFGEGLEAPLQQITVAQVMPLLNLAGVPAHVDGVLITIPNGYFEVAEACSGAKFVIAMLAYGVLVANVCFVSWPRRAAFMAMALVVPVLANGVRAFGTIYAAHLTSVEAATGYDHIVYGWVFFGLVMAAVLALGWHWFDRDPDAAWVSPAVMAAAPKAYRVTPLLAAALVLLVASVAPAWAAVIAGRETPLPARIELPDVPGWHRAPMSTAAPWSPNYPEADHFLIGRYQDEAGHVADLAIAAYGRQRKGAEIVGFGIGVLREEDRWVRVEDQPAIAGGSAMRITAPGPVERVVATWYRVDGVLTASPVRVKLATLRARLLGGNQAAVALHVSAEGPRAREAIARFVVALGPLDRLADRTTGQR